MKSYKKGIREIEGDMTIKAETFNQLMNMRSTVQEYSTIVLQKRELSKKIRSLAQVESQKKGQLIEMSQRLK